MPPKSPVAEGPCSPARQPDSADSRRQMNPGEQGRFCGRVYASEHQAAAWQAMEVGLMADEVDAAGQASPRVSADASVAVRARPDVARAFRLLVDEWNEETEDVATIGDRFMHRSYQQIIGLGPAAVPLLLRELEREPDYWFWALAAITRQNPVPPGASFDEAVEAWLRWGRSKGHV
jgi:hypothetical protein